MSDQFKPASMDDLLDMNLDDLADMPEFVVPPAGAYLATIQSISKKDINKHPAWEIKMQLNEVVELSDPTKTPPSKNAECSVAYMMDNEFGQGNFKNFMKPLAQHFGTGKVSEVVEQAKGLQVMILTTVRGGGTDANGEKKPEYFGVKSVSIP